MVWLKSGRAGGHDRTGAGMTRGKGKAGTNSGHKKRAHNAPLVCLALFVIWNHISILYCCK
jgi:hypothetical protein